MRNEVKYHKVEGQIPVIKYLKKRKHKLKRFIDWDPIDLQEEFETGECFQYAPRKILPEFD